MLALLLEVLEDKPDYQEVCGDGDAEDAEGGQEAVDAKPEEEIEKTQLQEIVEDVGTGEACTVFCRSMLAEGEVCRQVVVGEEAHYIADGKGDIDIDPEL